MKHSKIPRDQPHTNHVVKFRLYPNQIQEAKFQQNADATRFVWNTYKAARDHNYGRKLADLEPTPIPTLSEAKKLSGFEWLSKADSQSLRQEQMDLDKAYSQWFADMKKPDGAHKKQKPRFHSRFTSKHSFRVTRTMELDKSNSRIRVSTHKWIKTRGDWSQVPPTGSIQTITVSKSAFGWYASVLFRVPPVVLKNGFPFEACGDHVSLSFGKAVVREAGSR